MTRPITVLLPMLYIGVGFSSAAVSLAREMGKLTELRLLLPQLQRRLPADIDTIYPLPFPLPRALSSHRRMFAWARRRTEAQALAVVRAQGPGAIVWLWPGVSLATVQALKAAGAILVREMINTHCGTAGRILNAERDRVGLPAEDWDGRIAEERAMLALADLVVSPSEGVDQSLAEWGFAPDRIIRSTFGWEPDEFAHNRAAELPGAGPHAIFVGRVSVRKGTHLALAAWDAAAIDGTFVIVGEIDPEVEPLIARWRDRPDIVFLPYMRDLESIYRGADFMLFPTLEEGAPLVCYQAAGCGLPILTSLMGSGRLIESGITGLIVDPHDHEALVAGIRLMANDHAWRARMGREAKDRALAFTWTHAAQERLRQLDERLAALSLSS